MQWRFVLCIQNCSSFSVEASVAKYSCFMSKQDRSRVTMANTGSVTCQTILGKKSHPINYLKKEENSTIVNSFTQRYFPSPFVFDFCVQFWLFIWVSNDHYQLGKTSLRHPNAYLEFFNRSSLHFVEYQALRTVFSLVSLTFRASISSLIDPRKVLTNLSYWFIYVPCTRAKVSSLH